MKAKIDGAHMNEGMLANSIEDLSGNGNHATVADLPHFIGVRPIEKGIARFVFVQDGIEQPMPDFLWDDIMKQMANMVIYVCPIQCDPPKGWRSPTAVDKEIIRLWRLKNESK